MVTNEDDRQALADRLLSLSLAELVDVMRRVLPAHADEEGREESGLTRKLVLAEVTVFDDDISKPAVEVVAWPDRDHHGGGFGAEPGLFEQGRCRRCGVDMTSTAKVALCPICGERCHLT